MLQCKERWGGQSPRQFLECQRFSDFQMFTEYQLLLLGHTFTQVREGITWSMEIFSYWHHAHDT
jgi:hypothetical protein